MRQLLSGRGRRGGFTLIDVLVAAPLLAVAILFVSTIFPMGNSSVDAGGEVTEAAVLAEHMPEKIKSARWDDVGNYGSCSDDGCSTTVSSFRTGSTLVDAHLTEWKNAVQSRVRGGVGTVKVAILSPGYAPGSRVATVLVSVQFSHGVRGTKTVTVGTRISE